MTKELKQEVVDKVLKKIKRMEFIDACEKYWICPDCGEAVGEECIVCKGLVDMKLIGAGRFECRSCGNKFRYSEYK